MYSFIVDPACFDVVIAQGLDAERLLQGQLTCDVVALTDGGQGYGACCNNKGRVIAAFTIVRFSDTFYLCMAKGVGDIFITALKKFLPFYKCTLTLSDASHRLVAAAGVNVDKVSSLAGLTGPVAPGQATRAEEGWFCQLEGTEPRCLWWCNRSEEEIASLVGHNGQSNGLESWEALALLAGHFPFHPTDSELYTPQELHYEQNGYVSFSKGCYTGQEIVARMHYRGKQKKQLFLLRLQSAELASPSSISLQDKAGSSVGHSMLTRHLSPDVLALIQLPLEFATIAEDLHSPEGALLSLQPFAKK